MNKKLISTLLASAVVATGFSVPAFAEAEPVTITVSRATWNLATPDSEQVKKVEDAINEYLGELNAGVRIKMVDIGSGEYTDKVNLALANSEINLVWTASWENTIGTNDLFANNAAYDITDLLPGTPLYESINEGQWEATKYNGRNYYIPVYKDNVEGYDLMFRQDLIEKYGWDLSTIEKLEDIEPMLEEVYMEEGLKYPFLLQKGAMFQRFYLNDFDFFTGDQTSDWVAIDRDTNEVVDSILTDEYREFVTLMCKWAEMGYISEDEVTKSVPATVCMGQDWAISWWTDIPINDEADSRNQQDLTMAPLTERWAHSTSALGSCYCVSATSTEEEAKACIEFMSLLYTDSHLADIYTFGIEGEDFEYDENGQVVPNSDKYSHSMWESASATIVTPLQGEPADKGALYEEFNNSANTSCAAGFRFDKAPVASQHAACQNVFEEWGYALETGAFAVDDVPAAIEDYQTALDEAGYQDVLAEYTAQYEAWKNN